MPVDDTDQVSNVWNNFSDSEFARVQPSHDLPHQL